MEVNVGDYVVPSSAVREEGTSYHYLLRNVEASASKGVICALKELCEGFKAGYNVGPIWTTDAPYRETKSKIDYFQRKGVLGVDTESSAIFSLEIYRRVKVGCILMASTNLTWSRAIMGFYNEGLEDATLRVARTCAKAIRNLQHTQQKSI